MNCSRNKQPEVEFPQKENESSRLRRKSTGIKQWIVEYQRRQDRRRGAREDRLIGKGGLKTEAKNTERVTVRGQQRTCRQFKLL